MTISVVVPPVDPLPKPLDHSSGPLIGRGGDCVRVGTRIYSHYREGTRAVPFTKFMAVGVERMR